MTDPIIRRGSVRTRVGMEVDELDVTMYCTPDVMVGNVPLATFARNGGFDGARLVVTRSFAKNYGGNSCGSLHVFSGRVSSLSKISGHEVSMSIRSDLEILDVQMPRNVYMAQCIHTLYDTGCTLSKAAFTVTGNTTGGSTTSQVNCNLAQAAGYFDLGVIKFTSGQNNQVQRTVRKHNNGVVQVIPPLPYAPLTGDLFQIRPGCDKQLTTCSAKFSNSGNFRGYPFIPAPEQSY